MQHPQGRAPELGGGWGGHACAAAPGLHWLGASSSSSGWLGGERGREEVPVQGAEAGRSQDRTGAVMGGRGCGSGGDQQITGLELCTGLNGHVALSAAAKALVNELPMSALDGQVTDDRFQLRIIMWQTSCRHGLWTGWL